MARYGCMTCGWMFDEDAIDEELNIEEGTLFEDLPANFECPECGAEKDEFEISE